MQFHAVTQQSIVSRFKYFEDTDRHCVTQNLISGT